MRRWCSSRDDECSQQEGNLASGRVVVSAMETSRRWRQTAAVGLASTILAGFVAYGLLVVVELFAGEHSADRNPLPPPGDWHMRLAVLVVAVVFGAIVTFFWRRDAGVGSSSFVRGLSAFTAVAVVVAALSTVASNVALERSYLHSVPAGTASDSALLEAGQRACDWLRAKHWGRPSLHSSYMKGVTTIGTPTTNVISSTGRLASEFHYHLLTQPPSAMTRLEGKVSLLAWYRMCPFQQWVHRPVGNGD
jgi:hypothetical protein